MSKIDEKLREIAEKHHRDSFTYGSGLDFTIFALREAFRLGWEERNALAPHWASDTKERWTVKSARSLDHDEAECRLLGGACRSFAGEEGGG